MWRESGSDLRMFASVKRGDKGGSWDIAEEENRRAPTPEDPRIRPESYICVIRALGLNKFTGSI